MASELHVDAGGEHLEVHMFGQADQRIAHLRTLVFVLMFGNQASSLCYLLRAGYY
jgi:hypothetical protein